MINLYFFDNLDNLFKSEINLKKIKERERKQREIEEKYIERVKTLIIPKIKEIIQKRIDFIDDQKYKNCTEINILIDGEIECSEDKIESAKVNIENKKAEIRNKIRRTNNNEEKEKLNSELKTLEESNINIKFALQKLVNSIKTIIDTSSRQIEEQLKEMVEEIQKINNEIILAFSDESLNTLNSREFLRLFNFVNIFQQILESIKEGAFWGIIGFGIGNIGIGTASYLGLTATAAFLSSWIFPASIVVGVAGAYLYFTGKYKQSEIYKTKLRKLKAYINEQIISKFDRCIADLNLKNEEIQNLLYQKLEIIKNKIKDVDFSDFQKEYNNEKEIIKKDLKELFQL